MNRLTISLYFKEQYGQLVAFSSLGEQINFTPYGKDKFYGDRHPWWSIEFSRDETGAVNGLTNKVEGLRGTWFQLVRPLTTKMPK
ncbi:MAG: hypothetical protein AB8H12_00525 [Lewinella sp.]